MVAALVNAFEGLMHNSAMRLICFDHFIEKVLDLKIDFVLGPDNIALCYELGFEACNMGFCH